ncbi:hypothetical protein DFH07DRAFT_938636 [Mycena maculata]|uniref:F-box domain-containing protein n=1 Tax=Mycena maculata TaxID=230809 RepID=A0AAD7JNE0_9AGAR|nr:hypothetical protein DFH07DRAFT_938636 [Mycena maculata]
MSAQVPISGILRALTPSPLLARFSDEIILEIFENLTDAELLSLAPISKHIHDLALLSYLGRYGITESDIANNTFPQLSTSGAFPALRVARFITGLTTLRLRFDPSRKLDGDVRALQNLMRRLRINSVDMDFLSRSTRRHARAVRQCDMVGMLFTLVSDYHSRPCVAISPIVVSIIRPQKPPLSAVLRVYSAMRAIGSKRYIRKWPAIEEEQFRQELTLFPIMRAVGVIPSISVQAFNPPHALGTLIVLRASGISALRFPPNLKLSAGEVTAIFENLTLPLLRGVEAAFSVVSRAPLHGFLCRHPTLERLRVSGPPKRGKSTAAPPALPCDALPRLEHILGSAQLNAWVLASENPFPQLTVVTLELHKGASTADAYRSTLRGVARRPAIDTVSLQIFAWLPWDGRHFHAGTAPEREVPYVVDLRITFKAGTGVRNLPAMVEWLRLFPGLREVSLFDDIEMKTVCTILRKEFPQITFTAYKMGK